MKNLLFWLLALSALTGPVHAQYAVSGRSVVGADMSLYGMGEYENLGERIYIGALYIPQLESTIRPGSSKRMEMRIVADSLSARRFMQLWMDAITLNSSREERVAQAAQIQTFGSLYRNSLMRGDKVGFEYLASAGLTLVTINQVEIGAIPGVEFFTFLLDAWVGSTPLSGQLKSGILGKITTEERVQIKRQFAEIDFTRERQQDIARLYGDGPEEDGFGNENHPPERQENVPGHDEAGEAAAALRDVRASDEAQSSVESAEAARRAAERIANLEEDRLAKLEEERLAKLEEERIAKREEEIRATLANEVARLAAEKAAAERLERERAAAKQAQFENEQKLFAIDYRSELIKWLSNHVEYPARALDRRYEGKVELSVTSNRNGEILSKDIVISAGNSMLDQAALKMLERGSPLPAMPDNLHGETFSFSMPVSFSL